MSRWVSGRNAMSSGAVSGRANTASGSEVARSITVRIDARISLVRCKRVNLSCSKMKREVGFT